MSCYQTYYIAFWINLDWKGLILDRLNSPQMGMSETLMFSKFFPWKIRNFYIEQEVKRYEMCIDRKIHQTNSIQI